MTEYYLKTSRDKPKFLNLPNDNQIIASKLTKFTGEN